MLVPTGIRTARLVLRRWRAGDAAALRPVLESNLSHLGPWIPARVAQPAPVPALAERLSGFAADFDADRAWRYGIFTPDERDVLGEVDLFPRSAAGRVPFAEADRVEVGYWLRADVTGQGFATEAARAAVGVAARFPQLGHAEIRCDARNAPSAAIPRRLGFALAETIEEPTAAPDDPPVQLQVWTTLLSRFAGDEV